MFAGDHLDFTPAALCEQYGSRQAYLASVQKQTRANVDEGLLLPEEAQRTVEEAHAVALECEP